MATLTADQIEYIRMMSGDNCTPYDVDDTFMQKLFDRNLSDECLTITAVLKVRSINAASKVNESNAAGESRSLSQKYQQIRSMLAEWESTCGEDGDPLTIGTIDLDIDTDSDNTEAAQGYPITW